MEYHKIINLLRKKIDSAKLPYKITQIHNKKMDRNL